MGVRESNPFYLDPLQHETAVKTLFVNLLCPKQAITLTNLETCDRHFMLLGSSPSLSRFDTHRSNLDVLNVARADILPAGAGGLSGSQVQALQVPNNAREC
jgi:hypothetical protein